MYVTAARINVRTHVTSGGQKKFQTARKSLHAELKNPKRKTKLETVAQNRGNKLAACETNKH
jgi:hypothetical protein